MIDIEGLATTPDATILTIAAQSFNPFGTGYYDNRFFYARVTLESQEDRVINDETIAWWATQAEAQEEAFNENDRISLEDEVRRLLDRQHKETLLVEIQFPSLLLLVLLKDAPLHTS